MIPISALWSEPMTRYDAIVIGGGLVGSAIAYGLAREGLRVTLIDEGDVAYRASRGNFGLVWVQSKGDGAPHYQRWTRRSADEWPTLAAELSARTGISVGHQRPGGVHLCLGEAELGERRARMERMRIQSVNFGFEYRMLDRRELADMLPGLGPSVIGASWTPYDGHANPLNLLHAPHKAFVEKGGRYVPNTTVGDGQPAPRDFRIAIGDGEIGAPKVVLAAGLGNAGFGPAVRAERAGRAAKRPDPRHRAGPARAADADDDGPPNRRGRDHAGRQPGGCRFRYRPRACRNADDRPPRCALVSVAARSADRARLGGPAGHAARRLADL